MTTRVATVVLVLVSIRCTGMAATYEKVLVAITSKPDTSAIHGTGFIVGPRGLIVTADHVICRPDGQLLEQLWAIVPVDQGQPRKLRVIKRFKLDNPARDIAVLIPDSPIGPGLTVSIVSPEAGEEAVIGGFPVVLPRIEIWPLMRSGIIASVRWKDGGAPVLVLDLPGVRGFSGSPVLVRRKGVVGVFVSMPKNRPTTDLLEVLPSDFSFAAPISAKDLENLPD